MAKKLVTVSITKGTARFLNRGKLSDRQRAKYRGKTLEREIDFWEKIRSKRKWTPVTVFNVSSASGMRWIRRQLLYLEAANKVICRIVKNPKCSCGTMTEFKVKRKGK